MTETAFPKVMQRKSFSLARLKRSGALAVKKLSVMQIIYVVYKGQKFILSDASVTSGKKTKAEIVCDSPDHYYGIKAESGEDAGNIQRSQFTIL